MDIFFRQIMFIAFFPLIFATTGCSGNGSDRLKSEPDTGMQKLELSLPDIPASLTDPGERASYVAAHFWEGLDFSRDPRGIDTAFMEQNFVNFISILAITPEMEAQKSVAKLQSEVKASANAADLLLYVADRYLDDPNSPMRSEEVYTLFLRTRIDDPDTPAEIKETALYRMKQIMKNRPGEDSADFRFMDREGKSTSLHEELGDAESLLMFYDPDCDLCGEVEKELSRLPVRKDVKIIAIDTTDDLKKWKHHKDSLPENWVVGFATDPVDDKEIYVIRALPTFYLLDKTGKVLLKDPPVNILYSWITSG